VAQVNQKWSLPQEESMPKSIENYSENQPPSWEEVVRDAAIIEAQLVADTDATIDFLKRLRSDGPWHLVAIDPFKERGEKGQIEGKTFTLSQQSDAARWIEARQGRKNLYYTVNGLSHSFSATKASKADIKQAEFLHSDVDLKDHSVDFSEPTSVKAVGKAVLAKIAALPVKPTLLVDTGGGFQPLWKLREPIAPEPLIYDQEQLIEDVEARNKALAQTLGGDHCHNIDRIQRLPGTINIPDRKKFDLGRMPAVATLVYHDEAAVYELKDFPTSAPAVKQTTTASKVVPIRAQRSVGQLQQLIAADLKLAAKIASDGAPDRSKACTDIYLSLKRLGFCEDEVFAALEHAPVAEKFRRNGTLRKDIARVYAKDIEDKPFTNEEPQDWVDPEPIEDTLATVQKFDYELLPAACRDLCRDIAERMQCPPDFVAVTMIVVLGSILGRKLGIAPKHLDSWLVIVNLWALLIGRPSLMKSPAMDAVTRHLERLEDKARKKFAHEMKQYQGEMLLHELSLAQQKKSLSETLKQGGKPALNDLNITKPEAPICKRYLVDAVTVEKLINILKDNTNGLLIRRDEMVSLLKTLDRDEKAQDRGFYLSGWSGMQSFTYDTLGRGSEHVHAVCLSLIGTTQPGMIRPYMRTAAATGGGDGFTARFQLSVWPDEPSADEYRFVDRHPNAGAEAAFAALVERLDGLTAEAVGASEAIGDVPVLRFDGPAYAAYEVWATELGRACRDPDLPEHLVAHRGKYASLVPSLALILGLADGDHGAIGLPALRRAIAWADYLWSHALRAYAAAANLRGSTAKLIVPMLSTLPDPFTARDILQAGRSGLKDADTIADGLAYLSDLGWISPAQSGPTKRGGRPTTKFNINPKVGTA
jgi:hypothetical protein